MRTSILFCILLFIFSTHSNAQESLFTNLDYPELQVAPKASERLAQLAELEEKRGPLIQWTLWTSGFFTLYSATRNNGTYKVNNPDEAFKRESDYVTQGGILIGISWITLGTYMGFKHWTSGRLGEIKKIPGKDKRGELTRERASEEALEFASRTTTTLEDIAVVTNLAASLSLVNFAQDGNRIYGMIAATTSILPWLFPNPYSLGYQKHLEYKRKIYAPLVGFNFNQDKEPMMSWTWYF
jgi:hypothetical protein